MSIIKFHQDLEVYQKSFETAMMIFEVSKSFPKEKNFILSQTKSGVHHDQFQQIIVKLGGKENMKSLLLPNLRILKVKQEKHRLGFNLL
jgi:hypothetical protein